MKISFGELKNQKKIKFNAYCISCFHKEIWNKNLYTLGSNNPKIISIENSYEITLKNDKNFIVLIHKLNIIEKIKKINLILKSKHTNKSWNLNEITLNLDKEIILFSDLKINLNYLNEFIKDLKENCNAENNDIIYFFDDNSKISRNLKKDEKLNIYLEFLKKNKIDKEIKTNLVSQYFSTLKDDNEVMFSNIIELFNISFGTKEIIIFLDNYTKLNYNLDIKIENEEFTNILNLYKNESKDFYEDNEKYFKTVKIIDKNKEEANPVKKYKKLLENFLTIYQLFYEESVNIKEKRLKNVRNSLICILNNKKDLITYMTFIDSKFESFFKVFSLKANEKIKVEINLIENNTVIFFEKFGLMYEILFKDQEIKGKFFLDFSKVFNYFLDTLKDFSQIIKLKDISKKELNLIPNKDFENKIKKRIHNIGLTKIQMNNYDNDFLIEYIKNNEYYHDENKTKENKKYDIIKYFKLDLMDDKFFEKYNKYKIYSYFEENLLLYLSIFSANIKGIENIAIFFKLLPLEKYNKDTINLINEWLKKNINTFSKEKCLNFSNEMTTLFKLICKNKLISIAFSLILFLKDNLREYSKELFIFLLNSLDINIRSNIFESLINNILFNNYHNDNDDNIILSNANLILEKIKPNKVISRTLLNILQHYSIIYDDFFKENSPRFSFLVKLLNNKEYFLIKNDNENITGYWENTYYTCNSLCQDLINLNISLIKIKSSFNILGEENFKKRLINLFKCIDSEDYTIKAISIISNMNDVLSKWDEKLKMLELLKNYNNFIYNDSTNINGRLSKYYNNIIHSNLKYLNSKKGLDDFSKYSEDIKKAQIFFELIKSNVFLKIFNKTKNRMGDKKLLELVLDKFNNIKKIFVNDKKKIEEELKKNKEITYLINIGYQSELNLIKEIDYLLNYFEVIDFEYKDFLIEKIKMFVENKSLFSVISGILYLFENYKNILNIKNKINSDFCNELVEYQKLLKAKEYIPNEKINAILKKLEIKFQVNFANLEKKEKFYNLFIAINQFPKSIDFIKDKKLDQVNNLSEFLLESDDTTLNDKDINDFVKVVRFFEELINNKENNKTFFIFVKTIIDGILDDNKIGESLNNYIEKYYNIQTLFNQYLNHTEGCIKKIKNILFESKFTIELNNDNEYSLKGSYLISSIKNDNLIKMKKEEENNMRERILSCKKNDNLVGMKKEENNMKERIFSCTEKHEFINYSDLEYIFQRIYIAKIPEIYKESADKFINFFKNAKELIIILDELYRKGYPDIFKILINFKNSNITCYYQDKKNILIEYLLKDFIKLKNYVKKVLFNLYEKKEIIRFFHSRQLKLIFNNIINNNEIKNLELFKVVFNNAIQELKYNLYNFYFYNFEKIKETDKFKSIIYLIRKYIKKQLKLNNINIKDIYKSNEIYIPYINFLIINI